MEILTRSAQDPEFTRRVLADPSLLDQYDLTAEERSALATKDHTALEAMGVDERQTKFMARKPPP
jgi:hypothetical protein